MRNPYNMLLTVLLTGLAALSAFGQSRLRLTVAGGEAYVNEPFRVEVEVIDFEKDCGDPVFPDVPGCDVAFLRRNEEQRMSLERGRMTRSITLTFSYELTPSEAGTLVIPPITVEVDGEVRTTREKRVQVLSSDADELFAVEIDCPRERIYVGQEVPLTMEIIVKPASVTGRMLNERAMFRVDFARSSFGPFPRDQSPAFGGRRQVPTLDGGSDIYYVYTFSTDWIADRPGPLSFDDVQLVMHYPTQFGRNIFGELEITGSRIMRARPKVAATEVALPPAAGRPGNFSGAVGVFYVNTTARPTSARVGDPIDLTIIIRGDGPMETLPPPDLSANRALTDAFNVPQASLAGEALQGRRIYTQVIRPKRADVAEIPPIEFAYFDPFEEKYVVAHSDPIPITVAVAESLDTHELTTPEGTQAGAGLQPVDTLEGLKGMETEQDALLGVTPEVAPAELIAAVAAPPVLYLGLWGGVAYTRRRRDDTSRRRRSGALRTAQRRIAAASDAPPRERAQQLGAALSGYLADRLDQPPARFAGRDALDVLEARGVSEDVRQRWTELMDRFETAGFGGQTASDQADAEAARELLRLLERERL